MFGESPNNTIIFFAFVTVSAIQLLYNILFYLRTALTDKQRYRRKRLPVSVIICARNEAQNLRSFLPSVLKQDYPDFEVIIVNDCSEDDTEDVLKDLMKTFKNLRVTTIHKDSSLRHSKKMALFLGIKSAQNEHLLLTDADCQPVSENWISSICSGFTKKTDFILGYGGYLKEKGLLNKYIRFDAMFIAIQYMGMARAGIPYMGVGRNLAYKRSLFFDNKGFGNHLNMQSGDDDLFVNALARKNNTRVIKLKESFTRSEPSGTWSAFKNQKLRHTSTSGFYRASTKFLLILEPLSRILYYSLFLLLLLSKVLVPVIIPVFLFVLLIKNLVYLFSQKSLNENDLWLYSPIFDFLWPLISGFFLLGARRNKTQRYKWK